MRVAMYLRVSTDEQKVDLQADEMAAYCTFKKWENVTTFTDHGESGSKTSRPALDEMMAAVRRGEFDVVLVWKFDRVGRSTSHLIAVMEELKNLKVSFVSVVENIDTTSDIGKMVFTIFASLAEFERNTLITRTKAGMKAAQARGTHCGRKETHDHGKIVELLKNKKGPAEIAAELGCDPSTVRRVRQKMLVKTA